MNSHHLVKLMTQEEGAKRYYFCRPSSPRNCLELDVGRVEAIPYQAVLVTYEVPHTMYVLQRVIVTFTTRSFPAAFASTPGFRS